MAAVSKNVAEPYPGTEPSTDGCSTEGTVTLSRYLSTPCTAPGQGTVRFNPGTSYAVVAGVGRQLCPEAQVADLGTTADRDAALIRSVLTGTLKIPNEQVTVLNSRLQHASSSAIKTALRNYSDKVADDGVLILYFSGHCMLTKHGDKLFLAPADFKRTIGSAITPLDIINAVEKSAGYFVLILDCCYAGLFAERLISEAERRRLKVCVLASCTGEEKSLSHSELGNGFFTYFLADSLRGADKHSTEGSMVEYPAESSVEHCRPLCEAMLSLMRPGYGDCAKMTPGITFSSSATIQMYLSTTGEDMVDGPELHRGFALKYLTHTKDKVRSYDVPEVVRRWLSEDAAEALRRLHEAGVLGRQEVYVTVLGMMSQSVARIMYEDLSSTSPACDRLVILQPDLFILCFFRLSEVLLHISPDLAPDLCYMEHCLEHYMKKVHDLTHVDIEGEQFKDFITLLTCVMADLNRQGTPLVRTRRLSYETGSDTTDGDINNPKVEDIIRSLPSSEVERINTIDLLQD